MLQKNTTKNESRFRYRPVVEFLERRDTPSAGGGGTAAIDSVLLANYSAIYDGSEFLGEHDVITAEVLTTNEDGNEIYEYVWQVNGQTVETETSSSVTDTLDMTEIGFGWSEAEVTVNVSLLESGNVVSQGTANITDGGSPLGPAW